MQQSGQKRRYKQTITRVVTNIRLDEAHSVKPLPWMYWLQSIGRSASNISPISGPVSTKFPRRI